MHFPMNSFERAEGQGISEPVRHLVFVVEDDEDIARLISHNLQAAAFDVQSFVSAASVISEALREMPALFLLDVMLPGADGFDLCRQIRQTPVLSSTPIIFLTAKTAEADRVKGLELGGDDYITKPFSPRELVARVRSVLRGVRQTPAASEVLIPPARIPCNSSRARTHARSNTGCGVEGNALRHAAFHRCVHSSPPRKN